MQLLKLKEASQKTGLRADHLRDLIKAGRLPAKDISTGKKPIYAVLLSDLEAYVNGKVHPSETATQ